MQTVRRAVEADIGGDRAGLHHLGQGVLVGALEDEAARGGLGQKVVERWS